MSSFFIVTGNSPQPYAETFYTIRVAASCVDPTWGACQVTENTVDHGAYTRAIDQGKSNQWLFWSVLTSHFYSVQLQVYTQVIYMDEQNGLVPLQKPFS